MQTNKIIYWVSTGLLCLLLVGSAANYFFNYAMITDLVTKMSYPAYIVYPLGIAKLAAAAVILLNNNAKLKEWAYAALFFDFTLAFFAHYNSGIPGAALPLIAIMILLVSYFYSDKVRPCY